MRVKRPGAIKRITEKAYGPSLQPLRNSRNFLRKK